MSFSLELYHVELYHIGAGIREAVSPADTHRSVKAAGQLLCQSRLDYGRDCASLYGKTILRCKSLVCDRIRPPRRSASGLQVPLS